MERREGDYLMEAPQTDPPASNVPQNERSLLQVVLWLAVAGFSGWILCLACCCWILANARSLSSAGELVGTAAGTVPTALAVVYLFRDDAPRMWYVLALTAVGSILASLSAPTVGMSYASRVEILVSNPFEAIPASYSAVGATIASVAAAIRVKVFRTPAT